jgi:hypothetical protein
MHDRALSRRVRRCGEELVHSEGAFFHDGSELVAVDDFGGAGAGVAGKAGDFLEGDAGVGHEADEGVAEFAKCPGAGYAGGFDGGPEFAADVGGVQLVAVSGGEHRPGVAAVAEPQVTECAGGIDGADDPQARPGGISARQRPRGRCGVPRAQAGLQ